MKKNIITFLVLMVPFIMNVAFAQLDLSTPQKTFETLLSTIENKDLDTYKQLWVEERIEREGMYSTLVKSPEFWDDLQNTFVGPQTMTQETYANREGTEVFKCVIEAPDAGEFGIGTISMVKVGEQWLMHTW